MKTIYRISLSLLSALLLWLAWRSNALCLTAFIAFVPLFFLFKDIDNGAKQNKGKFYFLYSYLTFFLWNFSTTYWVWNSTPVAAAAWATNALLMSLVVYFAYLAGKRVSSSSRISSLRIHSFPLFFIIFWIAFEFLHYHWDLNWPWLALGNTLAPLHQLAQFYEFTGVTGGSLWILAVNVFVFKCLSKRHSSIAAFYPTVLPLLLLIVIPTAYSLIRYYSYSEKGKDVEVVIVQPNTDPYNQYNIVPTEVIDNVLSLIDKKITPNTALIVAPESMILDYAWENRIETYPSIGKIQNYLQNHPSTEFISGISTIELTDKETAGTRISKDQNGDVLYMYNIHNTALLMSKEHCSEMYFKSRLTPGVEIIPFADFLPFMNKMAVDLGGATGSLDKDDCPKVFRSEYGHPAFAANICYESVFPDYVRQFTKKGAEYICIITNDGWWGNTEGYHQHQRYAKLRAIENRRAIARSANTGISCFINQRGDVSDMTNYWETAVISKSIKARKGNTVFVILGDYIGLSGSILAVLLLLFTLWRKIKP
ncbi:apolipoprotein N-acyltransferase [Bacteroidia bacterium]|nr:apolipoprotein N-acyltransferase [Bacteroidia bacterium]